MSKAQPRIVEILLKRSKKNPKYAHAVGLLFPCNHTKYLGMTYWPANLLHSKDRILRVQTITIYQPIQFAVMDAEDCFDQSCNPRNFWLDKLGVSHASHLLDGPPPFDTDDDL